MGARTAGEQVPALEIVAEDFLPTGRGAGHRELLQLDVDVAAVAHTDGQLPCCIARLVISPAVVTTAGREKIGTRS